MDNTFDPKVHDLTASVAMGCPIKKEDVESKTFDDNGNLKIIIKAVFNPKNWKYYVGSCNG